MWKSEFLPSIPREVKLETEALSATIQVLTDRYSEMSSHYSSCPISTIQSDKVQKKQIAGLEANVKEQMDQISKIQEADYGAPSTQCSSI